VTTVIRTHSPRCRAAANAGTPRADQWPIDPDNCTLVCFDVQGQVLDALHIRGGLTLSGVGRRIRFLDVAAARAVLTWLVTHHRAHTCGNGAWTHYHPGKECPCPATWS
jgi:hypothetical protein